MQSKLEITENQKDSKKIHRFFLSIAVFSVTGTCVAVYGNKPGEACYRDSDCESGLLCIGRAHHGVRNN
jgi:hypothetical protein